jgi:hypothetical protein
MNPSIEDSDAASTDIAHRRLPLRRLRHDTLWHAWVAAERTRRGTLRTLGVKRPGRTTPTVPAGRVGR